MSTPKGNAVLVEALSSSLRRGGNALGNVPGLLKQTLEKEAWREFVTPRGELVRPRNFAEFITTPPTAGLGAEVDLIRRMVADDPEAVDLLDRALQNRRGRPEILNNVQVKAPEGNGRDTALRRLRKNAPELHAEVVAGRISAHAAMVQAGFRPRTATIPIGRGPSVVADSLRRYMSPDEIAALIACLLSNPSGPTTH